MFGNVMIVGTQVLVLFILIGAGFVCNKAKILSRGSVKELTKEEVKTDKVGEILISGPSVMLGYLNDEVETNKILEKDKNGKIFAYI